MRKNLTKKELVRKKSDISRIFKEGRSVSTQGMRLVYRENGLDHCRIIVIPAKKYGNAVERNTVKRRCKEIFRIDKDRLTGGYDLACIVYPGKVYDYSMRKEQFFELIGRAGLFI